MSSSRSFIVNRSSILNSVIFLFIFLLIFNCLIMNHVHASLIDRKILLIRFYKEGEEVEKLETDQQYSFDILTRNLSPTIDQVFLIKNLNEYLIGDEVLIDQTKDIYLNLSSSPKYELFNRFSNYELVNYIASFLNESFTAQLQYFNIPFEFNKTQDGNYTVCVSTNKSNDTKIKESCIHQGINDFLTISVFNNEINLPLVISITIFALLMSALTSGLTLGIMSLDTHELQVLIKAGNKEERNAAKAILPLRKKGNFLLCTFVIANTVAESLLNYMANFYVHGPLVIVFSAVFLVLFGSILPLALSTRYGLSLGAGTIYITYIFILILCPVSYPLSFILDRCLGEETPTVYDKERLIEYIKLTRPINKLENAQLDMITGVVYLRDKTVAQAMTKLKDVYMIPVDTLLTPAAIREIFKKGFSRIPVYKDNRREKIISILFLKDLVLINMPITVKELIQKTKHLLAFTDEDEKITKIFYYMKKGKTHMIIVKKSEMNSTIVTGIITLEDIIEEILQTEISDESDYQNDSRSRNRRDIKE